jgi:hypothetical protein
MFRVVPTLGFAAYQFIDSRTNRKVIPLTFTYLFVPPFRMGNPATLRMVKD